MTLDPEGNVARVRAGLEAFNAGEEEAVLQFFDPEIEIYSAPELANPGSYRGHEGYKEWVGQWLEAWDQFQIDVVRVEPVGGRHVVAGVHQHARGKGSGVEVDMRIAYMFELGESNTTAFHLYPTWEEATEEAERREREGP